MTPVSVSIVNLALLLHGKDGHSLPVCPPLSQLDVLPFTQVLTAERQLRRLEKSFTQLPIRLEHGKSR